MSTPWSPATEALWRATLNSDVTAARRALFQGADACAERMGPTLGPALVQESPFARVAMGRPHAGAWAIDLALLDLLLDHGAEGFQPDGKTAMALVVASRAVNADQAVGCLVAHGAEVNHEYAASLLISLGMVPPAPPTSAYRFATDPVPLLDALWHYTPGPEQQALLRHVPALMHKLWERTEERPDPRAVAWLATHGASLDFLPTVAPPVVRQGNVVPLRPRRR